MDGTMARTKFALFEEFQHMADSLDLGFIALSASGDVQAFNTAYAVLAGIDAATAPKDIKAPAALGSSDSSPIEASLRQQDGRQIAVRADRVSTGANGEKALFVREILGDQTLQAAKRKHEETIRRFDILTDRSGMGMWLAGPDNLILEANPAMARLLELAGSDALIGQDPFANTPLDEQPWLRESLANLSPDGAASIRHNLLQASGTVIRVQSDMTRDPVTGGYITFVRAVTEEEQLVRDLAGRNQDLEHFSIAASHDLREPMRKITIYAGMLEEDLADVMSDTARRDLAVISDASKRMSALVEMLSVYVNLKENIGAPKTVELVPLIKDVMEELDTPDGVNLSIDAPEPLFIDEAALRRLCRAVLSNCIAYRRQDAPLIIQAKAQWKSADTVVLTFTDNGEGVPQDQRTAVLAPLKRLRSQGISPGSGMGLAICARIAEYYGGSVLLQASSSGGAVVIIELRLTRQDTNASLNCSIGEQDDAQRW